MLPVANHLPLRFENPRQSTRSRIRRAAQSLRSYARESVAIHPRTARVARRLLDLIAITVGIATIAYAAAWLVCTL